LPEFSQLLISSSIAKITWIFSPGYAGVKGNKAIDRLILLKLGQIVYIGVYSRC
jgi:hypothetical protein